MRLLISLAAALGLSIAMLAACNPQDGSTTKTAAVANNNTTQAAQPPAPVAPPAPPADGARRITVDELKAAVDKNEAVILDVRSAETYQASRIKGAQLFVESEIDKHLSELPKGKLLVAYCS